MNDADYTFRASENVPPFLFISVLVALFLGLSVSAEEILRDRTLLKREQFLQVKWHNFVHAKLAVVAAVSVVHSLGFVLVSHAILDIRGFMLTHTLVLFAVAFFGNVWAVDFCAIQHGESHLHRHPTFGDSPNHLWRRDHSI